MSSRANQCTSCGEEMYEGEGQVCGACKVKNGIVFHDDGTISIPIDNGRLSIEQGQKPHIFINGRELPECESYVWFEAAIQEKAARELQPEGWTWIKDKLPGLSTKVDIVAIDKQGNLSIEYDSWVRRHPDDFVAWMRVVLPEVDK